MQRRFRSPANSSASPGIMDIPLVAVFARMLAAPEPRAEAFRQALSLPNRWKGRDQTWQSEEERACAFRRALSLDRAHRKDREAPPAVKPSIPGHPIPNLQGAGGHFSKEEALRRNVC